MSSTLGQIFTLTTFGESHGYSLGGVVDGCPAGLALNEELVQAELNKRRPGQGLAGTTRKEADKVHLVSGLFEGRSTGTPIAFFIANENSRSADYGPLACLWRPGHADISYDAKYGQRDFRGGGRASARETAARVAGGAIAQAFLRTLGVEVQAATVELGGVGATAAELQNLDWTQAADRAYCAATAALVPLWDERVQAVRAARDTVGGVVRVRVSNVPAGLGEPVFHKLDAVLAMALMSVGAVKGVEVGEGFNAARLLGSQNNDVLQASIGHSPENFCAAEAGPYFATNHAGGILGGISTGQDIELAVAIKPIPSVAMPQHSLDQAGRPCVLQVGGRHDICAIPRVVPVLRAMTALVLADMVLLQQRMNVPNCAQQAGRA